MAAQANSTSVKSNRRQRATNSQKRSSIKKSTPTQRAGSRSSERLRNKQLASYVQVPSCLTPISRPALTKRKRSQDLEAEDEADQPKDVRPLKQLRRLPSQPRPVKSSATPPASIPPPARRYRDSEAEVNEPKDKCLAKQPRKSTPPRLEPFEEELSKDFQAGAKADKFGSPLEQPQEPPPLSENDSQSLQSLYKEVMDSASNKALKRTSSRRSIVQSETGSDRTQRSSNTNAVYRRQNLAAVKIRLHAEPPNDVETTIKGIINAKFPKQRRAELDVVAKEFCNGCLKNVRAQSGEDDFIDPLHTAIKALRLKKLCVHEKADWRPELKPVVRQQTYFSSSFMTGIQQLEVDDASAPPPKRQQQSFKEYISPESSTNNATAPPDNNSQGSNMKPPPALIPEKEEDRSPAKTPRPDLSIGIDLDALISALSSQNLNKDKATEFIDWLQNEKIQHETDEPLKPMLLLIPAPRALDLAFPFAVIEGKAYSTGKQIFEAENQAAVSVACAHNILRCLDRMANRGKTMNTQTRVLFSITTQGPIHELWAHWTVVKGGVLVFESKLWDSWNGLVSERAADFLGKLNSICVWGTGPFMQSVVEGLRKVAVQAQI